MKYFKGKIKREHNVLKEFDKFFVKLEKIKEIQKIIPGRISRKQSGSSLQKVSISYFTSSGIKIILKKGSTVQEVFIVCKKQYGEKIKNKVSEII